MKLLKHLLLPALLVVSSSASATLIDFKAMANGVASYDTFTGLNYGESAWIRAYYETDAGPATLTTAPGNFAISPTESHTYGVYVKQPTVSCAVITRIEIEPTFVWGVGDFGISTGGCTEVPEPNSLTLFGIGMLVLGLAFYGPRRRLQIEQV